MFTLTRSEIEADIAELDALIDDGWRNEKGCLHCGAERHYSRNGSSSLAHKRMWCTRNLVKLRRERRQDLEFLDSARHYAKFEE